MVNTLLRAPTGGMSWMEAAARTAPYVGRAIQVGSELGKRLGRSIQTRRQKARTGVPSTSFRSAVVRSGEKKAVDTDIDGLACSYDTATVTLLNGASQGTAIDERIGLRARMASVKLNLSVLAGSQNTPSGTARVMLVRINNPCGVDPAIGDIVTGNNQGLSRGQPDLNNRGSYEILRDWMFSTPDTAQYSPAFTIDEWVPLRKQTRYQGTGNTIASITQGAVYLFVLGSNLGDTNTYKVYGTVRLRFFDQ